MKKLLVIIPVYNEEEFLANAIESNIQQRDELINSIKGGR